MIWVLKSVKINLNGALYITVSHDIMKDFYFYFFTFDSYSMFITTVKVMEKIANLHFWNDHCILEIYEIFKIDQRFTVLSMWYYVE